MEVTGYVSRGLDMTCVNHRKRGVVVVYHDTLSLLVHKARKSSIILLCHLAAALRLFILRILVLGEIVLLQ